MRYVRQRPPRRSEDDLLEDVRITHYIGRRIRERRTEHEQTQPEVAAFLHVDKSLISCYEQGRSRAPLGVLYRLARLWHLHLIDFLPLTSQEILFGAPDRRGNALRRLIHIPLEDHTDATPA